MIISEQALMTRTRAQVQPTGARWDHAFAIGPADVRPCGCINDPVVFGHTCRPGRKENARRG